MEVTGLKGFIRFPHILWWRRNCPLCSSIEFQAAELGSWDNALGLLALNPVRCTNCWRRYYWFAREAKNSAI